jgi:hypothetical protein
MYSNLPITKITPPSTTTVPTQLNNNVLVAMIGILETRGWTVDAAENISIAILTQAKKDGYNAMQILESIKNLDQIDLSGLVAEILNNNRYKTSNLGVIQTVIPVDNVKRNIIA